MTKGRVRVYVRTRPVASNYDGFKVQKDGETLSIDFQKDGESGLINNQPDNVTFKFDGVLNNVSQDAVYNTCAQAAIDNVLAGYNATIFCYGQTGAGKTFTMSGDPRNYHHRGIIPRALHQIFREVDMRVDRIYTVQVSYMEIYNEALYDLLSDNPAASESLAIMEDSNGNTQVRGLTKVPVRSEEEGLAQYFQGDQGRSTSVHILNANSSRSHVLFTIHVEMRTSEAASERAVVSKLNLVDLAGSERTKKTNATGQTMREANAINKSLTFLEQVVNALARKDSFIPFRQTKLTAALKDALGGNCITVMVANLWPEPIHIDECVSTLRFASRVRTLVTEAVVNESGDPELLLKRAERQIKELKQELIMRDMLSGRVRVNYDDLSQAEVAELQQLVRRYLEGAADIDELPIDSIKQIKETYKAFKAVALAGGLGAAASGQAAAAYAARNSTVEDAGGASDPNLVGDVDAGQARGFHVGTAPPAARPISPAFQKAPSGVPPGGAAAAVAMRRDVQSLNQGVKSAGLSAGEQTNRSTYATQRPVTPGGLSESDAAEASTMGAVDRNELFFKYKRNTEEGRRLAAAVKAKQQQLNQLKEDIKVASVGVNSSKQDIDTLSQQLEGKRAAAGQRAAAAAGEGSKEEVLDNEQYVYIQQLKAAKAKYRAAFDQLKDLRDNLAVQAEDLAAAKTALLSTFEAWSFSEQNAGAGGGAGAAQIGAYYGDDELDPGEAFEQLEASRIMATNPDSSAFHAARKRAAAAAARGAAGSTGGRPGR